MTKPDSYIEIKMPDMDDKALIAELMRQSAEALALLDAIFETSRVHDGPIGRSIERAWLDLHVASELGILEKLVDIPDELRPRVQQFVTDLKPKITGGE